MSCCEVLVNRLLEQDREIQRFKEACRDYATEQARLMEELTKLAAKVNGEVFIPEVAEMQRLEAAARGGEAMVPLALRGLRVT